LNISDINFKDCDSTFDKYKNLTVSNSSNNNDILYTNSEIKIDSEMRPKDECE